MPIEKRMAGKQKPIVSIILPTWNGSAYLEQSIASCRLQTYKDWELIIVDDASTDATPTLIERLKVTDHRISSRRHPFNLGLPTALNTGFEVAQGRYFTWTSDDNYYHPDAIAELVRFMESRFDVDLVYSDFFRVDASGRVLDSVRVGEPGGLVADSFRWPVAAP